jgi:hypothetical protein
MNLDYTISYRTYKGEERIVKCEWFEDAEKIAAFLATQTYFDVVLSDNGKPQYTDNFSTSKK